MSTLEAPTLFLRDHTMMGLREKIFACLLALRAGLRVDRADWEYDADSDVVVVTTPAGQTWGRVRVEYDDAVIEIMRLSGARTRADMENYARG